jgi:hypothetical protein
VRLQPLAKLGVLEPRARQHGDEAPAGTVDVVEVVVAAELRVRHVEEVRPPGHGPQRVPGRDVGDGVVGVAVGDPEGHRHPALGLGGEDEEQLLQIGAVVLRVAVDDGRRRAATHRAPGGGAVLPAESDRGRIVVQLIEAHAELLSDREHDRGEQCRAIGVEEPIERAADAVVAEMPHLLPGEPEELRREADRGLLLAVDRFALDDDRAQQHAERGGVRHGAAPIAGGHVVVQQRREAQALEEVVDQG